MICVATEKPSEMLARHAELTFASASKTVTQSTSTQMYARAAAQFARATYVATLEAQEADAGVA